MIKKKQLIKEIMGVPKALTPWVNSFYEIIINAINNEIKSGWVYEGELEYVHPDTGEEVSSIVKKIDPIVIPGNEVMDSLMEINGYNDKIDFLKSEMFKGLPLWGPSITILTLGLPNEVISIEEGSLVSAAINTDLTQGLSKIGSKIKVLPKVSFKFETLRPLDGKNVKSDSDLKAAISHELLHAYQKFKQLESGKPSHYGKESALNIMPHSELLLRIGVPDWKEFLHLIYLHLSYEINARVTEVYYYLKELDIDNKEDFLKEIKKTGVWKEMESLKKFNAKTFIENFKIPSLKPDFGTKNPLKMLHDIVNGVSNRLSMKQMGIDTSSKEDMLKSMVQLWDTLLQVGNEHIKQETGVDFDMLPVPDSAKKDPYLFFKFFEKRFHKKAEKWEKKLYRIWALLLQEKEEALQKNK